MRADFGFGEYHRAGGHEGAFAYFGIVHHSGTHADESQVVDFAAVERDVVADRHVIADFDGGFLI